MLIAVAPVQRKLRILKIYSEVILRNIEKFPKSHNSKSLSVTLAYGGLMEVAYKYFVAYKVWRVKIDKGINSAMLMRQQR